jgi:hypothetical protein
MNNSKSIFDAITGPRLVLAAMLLGTVALVGACSPTQSRTTTTEQTTSHEIVPTAPPATSVTTTKTQVYTP